MRKFRYIEEGHGDDSLSPHEKTELRRDFDIDIDDDYYVIVALTEREWIDYTLPHIMREGE